MATVLITGANRGIGLELTRQMSARGDHVLAACRRSSPELEGCSVEIIEGIDVSADSSMPALRTALDGRSIDTVINNAGILRRETLDDLDFDSMRSQFETNTLGPLRVTQVVTETMEPGSKIIIITSRMGSIADNTSGGSYGYRMSKCAINMAAVSLARDLASKGIAIALLHPGWVKTEMTAQSGLVSAEESARALIERVDELGPSNSGTFWHMNGEILPW